MAWLGDWRWACGGLLLAAVHAGGCTLVTDVGDFEQEPGQVCSEESEERRDMNLQLTGYMPHLGEDMEFRVVTTEDPPMQRALARLLPLGSDETLVEMPGAIPRGSHRIDFYADTDGSGDYTPPDAEGRVVDHSWSIDPCMPRAEFPHDFEFDTLTPPILPGAEARIRFLGMPEADVRFELRVIEESTEATVGLVRMPGIDEEFEVTIDGIIDSGFSYRVAFYLDINGNGAYDPPPVDEAWEITGITDDVDVTFEYDPDAVTDIGF